MLIIKMFTRADDDILQLTLKRLCLLVHDQKHTIILEILADYNIN